MSSDIWETSKEKDVDFVRINARSLVASLRDECIAWVMAIGKEMDHIDTARVAQIRARLAGAYTRPRFSST
jgi:hypothetical protein